MHADFVLEGDLVDACKPGDRVMMTGVYKPLGGRGPNVSGAFRSVVVVNSVEQLSQAVQASADISADDLREMKDLASKDEVLDMLGSSLAPSIYGHDWIKKVRRFLKEMPPAKHALDLDLHACALPLCIHPCFV